MQHLRLHIISTNTNLVRTLPKVQFLSAYLMLGYAHSGRLDWTLSLSISWLTMVDIGVSSGTLIQNIIFCNKP